MLLYSQGVNAIVKYIRKIYTLLLFASNSAWLPSDVIDFAKLPAQRFWRETVSLFTAFSQWNLIFFRARGRRPVTTDMAMKLNLATPSTGLLPTKDGVGSLF